MVVVWITTAGPDRIICRGASTILGATLSGNAAATYLWTPNLFLNDNTVANPVATTPVTTTYTLHVTQNGCTKTAEVTVNVDVTLNPKVTAGFDKTLCNTSSETVELGGPADANVVVYQWSTNEGNIIGANNSTYNANPSETTTYYVTGYTAEGCFSVDSARITIITCGEICNNGIDDDGDGQIDCEDAYSWENIGEVDGNGTTISSVSYNYVDYNLAPGTYFYRLMQVDFDGIYDYSEVKSVEIFESTTFKSMSISPNPVSAGSAINIAGGSNEVFQIKIMSFNGQAIFETVTNSRSVSIADLNLTPGVYMVEITDGNKTYTEKLVVQ